MTTRSIGLQLNNNINNKKWQHQTNKKHIVSCLNYTTNCCCYSGSTALLTQVVIRFFNNIFFSLCLSPISWLQMLSLLLLFITFLSWMKIIFDFQLSWNFTICGTKQVHTIKAIYSLVIADCIVVDTEWQFRSFFWQNKTKKKTSSFISTQFLHFAILKKWEKTKRLC